ncbi:MAG: putative transcriptional regulator, GntR family [Firmicutes bacterium]|nr:putative transcriptional regulator, GntR family [Bacillota bacterium]
MYGVKINRSSDLTITKQLYQQIRKHILEGTLHEGDRLPATRKFASTLSISRNIVLEVYDQLRIEGYVQSRPGSYTSVASGACLKQPAAKLFAENGLIKSPSVDDVIDFRYGVPALALFPRKLWNKAIAQIILDTPAANFGYNDLAGCPKLRTSIANYLFKTRGISCKPKQIIITSGSTQAFTLITQLLLSSNRKVIVEDPLNDQFQKFLVKLGCNLNAISIDQHGLQTSFLLDQPSPAFSLVTPSQQFPTGGILPIQRRIELIQFARKTNSYIVEDDYENEFTYEGIPISALHELDPENVIYVGTFSKTLIPTLRLGYLILPNRLIEKFYQLDCHYTEQPSAIEQLALSSFIDSGQFQRHINKMNKVYRKRRNKVISELNHHFGNKVKIIGSPSGLHLTAQFENIQFTPQFIENIIKQGIYLYSVQQHVIDKSNKNLLNQAIFGYGNLNENDIALGIERLKTAITK